MFAFFLILKLGSLGVVPRDINQSFRVDAEAKSAFLFRHGWNIDDFAILVKPKANSRPLRRHEGRGVLGNTFADCLDLLCQFEGAVLDAR